MEFQAVVVTTVIPGSLWIVLGGGGIVTIFLLILDRRYRGGK
jgi:hypothetical protein